MKGPTSQRVLTIAALAELRPWCPASALRKAKRVVEFGPPPTPNRQEHPYEGTCTFQGMDIYVENMPGSHREGVDADGKPWKVKMSAAYGEFADTLGMDGDPVDVFVGSDPDAPNAYVVHQKHPGTQVADEDKVVLGVASAAEARKLFHRHYTKPGFYDGITPWPVDELREFLKTEGWQGKRLDRPKRVEALVKGVPIKGRPGLRLDEQKHRWVRVTPKEQRQQERPQAQPDEPRNGRPPNGEHPSQGKNVQFRHPETGEVSQGRIQTVGNRGAVVVDDAGEQHRVEHGDYVAQGPEFHKPEVRTGKTDAEPRAMTVARTFLGDDVTPEDLAHLGGIPLDAHARISAGVSPGSVMISGRNGDIEMTRFVRRGPPPQIENALFLLPESMQGKGIGTDALLRQARQAETMGVEKITTYAAGRAGEEMVGYYVWPRLGYDGDIPDDLPEEPPGGEKRVSELMATPRGREWWKANGEGIDLEFDPSSNSLSRRVLERYQQERQQRMAKADEAPRERKPPPTKRGTKGDMPPVLTPQDDELLDRIWEEEAGERQRTHQRAMRKAQSKEDARSFVSPNDEERKLVLRAVPPIRPDLRALLKATISTPRTAEGKVNYEGVPVGASIWVSVTDETSPLHGRPILITKRPDHQFALTGGSGQKHIKARRHLTMAPKVPRAAKADIEAEKRREEIRERQRPKREAARALRKEARAAQKTAETQFMSALGIQKRGLSEEEQARVKVTASRFAAEHGMDEKSADRFGHHLSRGIGKKEREHRTRLAAKRLEWANAIQRGAAQAEAEALAGADPTPIEYTMPEISATDWSAMSEPEREQAVNSHLDQQEVAHLIAAADDARYEDDAFEGQGEPSIPSDGTEDLEETDKTGDTTPDNFEREISERLEEPVEPLAAERTEPETITVGKEVESKPILSKEAAGKALEAFREFAQAKAAEREITKTLETLPPGQLASPAALDELRLRTGAVSDEEIDNFLADYAERAWQATDTGFYEAMSPHWNEDIGNKIAGATARAASTAITALVGEETGIRYDVQRLVDALGPETAAMATVRRMREEMDKDQFRAWVTKLRDNNIKNMPETEKKALARHHDLQKQSADLERQVEAGDLRSEANVAMLRARNLLEQRENLGSALGSMQASAALFHFAEDALVQRYRRREPVTINVGSKLALDDKLKRLGRFRRTVSYHPQHGYQIHTDTEALRRFASRTELNKSDADRWRQVKYDTSDIDVDEEGREWASDYSLPGFRPHFGMAEDLPVEAKHLAGQPVNFLADQRNNIEWIHGSGGGLVTMRTGGGKTVVSIGVAAKMIHDNPKGRHLRIVPDGREEQWAAEISQFTNIKPIVLPGKSTKDERHRILAAAPEGSIVIVGHKNAGRYDHEALATFHEWDSLAVDEPQELTSKTGSGKLSAGARRIFKIPAKNRHAITATPAAEHAEEAYDLVNWARPGVLGYRTRFARAFTGFGSGTNAQDAAIQRMLFNELEPHMSGDRLVPPHYAIDHSDVRVKVSPSQRLGQREIEGRVDAAVSEAVEASFQKKRDGVRGYENKSYQRLRREATTKALDRMEKEHNTNLGAGDVDHNPKLRSMAGIIDAHGKDDRHVIFVDSPDQRRAVSEMLYGRGVERAKVKNITAAARGQVRQTPEGTVSAIEARKQEFKRTPGSYIILDRTSAAGHNLAEGDHLHVLGSPDDAAQLLQVHGRLGRSNRIGDFKIHTYRYEDSPFEHHTWNRLERQLKILRSVAPGMFVEGRKRPAEERLLAKAARVLRLVLRRTVGV